jgi:hypothetical protein
MYMAKAIAAFVSLVVTALVSAPDIIPVAGTVHLVISIIAIVAGAVTTYAIPNRGTTVVDRVVN